MLFDAKCIEGRRGEPLFDVTMQKSDGEIEMKRFDLSGFMHLLDASKVQDENYIEINRGIVPDGYLGGVFASDKSYTVVWEVPARKRQFVLDMRNGEKLMHAMIPFPALVFKLRVYQGIKQSFSCYAKKEGDTNLYRYPFGNVSLSGDVCMGSIATKDITPRRIEEDFFLGETNNDYYTGDKKCGCDWSQEKLIRELKEKDSYPDNWLVDAGVELKTLLDFGRYAKERGVYNE